ncbi:4-oxalocrotonate decarboxylase [Pseudoxanthomonas broegbernensis]|uniref:4-oxalocrotonate decarboxylase n=1 Tax=Pseudoxanthomonas broegbernensis TaxID=83619 RepID=A0A7V8GKP6_9GAMM|nr:fumarylacetoacetate hydrolase family protein [Pseudoxanthomonas broegbernensis]KAF1685108.1 4-oxalocrotonate decarboxylase [Pseudoxanthomonas broegbernensis]MBB6066229.1 2-oxo-3-hexenedioate decarboxylase [Pseudoxanthomonas broegbernensis]
MNTVDLNALAQRLDAAAHGATATPQLEQAISLEQAYAIQKLSIERRLARGERRIGIKMGFTSRAKMVQMGVSDMIWGRLTSAMLVEDGAAIRLRDYVHPRVEPEVAFLIARPLAGRVTAPQALAAVEAVAPALEIIDSRYRDFRFSLTDVVADNSSSSGFVVGPWRSPATDLDNLGLVMSFDGRPQAFGSTAAILGHPLRSLVAAARVVAEAGERLEPGDIVLAGGATAASALIAGTHVSLEAEALGRCGFHVEE